MSEVKLPSDFDIFSPPTSTQPLCPVLGEGTSDGDGLGPLVLVVGELEVEAAAVQVEAVAEQVERHHDALGVPARPAVAPGRRPRRLARLGLLPQREVERRALLVVRLDPRAGAQRVERLAGQQPVVRPRSARREVDARRSSRRPRRSSSSCRPARPSGRRRRWRGACRRDARRRSRPSPPTSAARTGTPPRRRSIRRGPAR